MQGSGIETLPDQESHRSEYTLLGQPVLSAAWSLGLGSIVVLAAVLRFYHLDASSLWSDEGNTWAMMSRGFGEIAQAASADIHPPGYYWLLKLWTAVFGTDAFALRSFSALAGVLLVFVIVRIGQLAAPDARARRWLPLLAAFLAAANPFQVYYSQEARMYMLLALESAGLFWALLAMSGEEHKGSGARRRLRVTFAEAIYLVCGIAGMWTHYSFPIVLAAACLSYLIAWLLARRQSTSFHAPRPSVRRFLLLNLLILLAFAPWLPLAVASVLHWPKGGASIGLVDGLALTLRTLLFGPLRVLPDPLWPWLVAAGTLPLLGMVALRRGKILALALWLLLPAGLMAMLGLFTDAFLKFLLIASPAWCLLVGSAALLVPWRLWGAVLVGGFGLAAALVSLPAYYGDPGARDNYQGVARYLSAVGDPSTDLVILDAPGQKEVWDYYNLALPVLALPNRRPSDRQQIEAALAAAIDGRHHLYVLFWAADEADPDQIVERWLDQNSFKALDSWQGNMRFAAYTLAGDLLRRDLPAAPFGDALELLGQGQPAFPQSVEAGEVALVRLWWSALKPITQRYKVTIQLLDGRDQVVAQRDSEPAGGSRPTDGWQVGETVVDNYALPVPFGTPPGVYRLVAAVYDPATGARLARLGQDFVDLGMVTVLGPAHSLPLELVPMQHRLDHGFDSVRLAGYDAYRKGFVHVPETSLLAGDLVHFTLYWQAPEPLPVDWPVDLTFSLRLGGQKLTAPLAGGNYATGGWQPGELVRGEFDLLFDGTANKPAISIGDQSLELSALPN